ncbi:MAG: hypothetical protein HZB19_01480 [Chloroflexi bacterium]|nr:hypothetical protein [Chloroflexota bacterium]
MEDTTPIPTGDLLIFLAQRVDDNRTDLISRYQQALRETLFANRAEVRPNMLKNIAADEAEALLSFLHQSALSGAERGKQLYQTGLGEQAVLRLGEVTRHFFLTHLECEQFASMLETVHAYQETVIQGFVQGIEKNHLIELERTRNALQGGSS